VARSSVFSIIYLGAAVVVTFNKAKKSGNSPEHRGIPLAGSSRFGRISIGSSRNESAALSCASYLEPSLHRTAIASGEEPEVTVVGLNTVATPALSENCDTVLSPAFVA
jgi:hypothetical protein